MRKAIPSLCKDCNIDTTPNNMVDWEWYIVTDTIWDQVDMIDGFLCIGCLETRLGRQLTHSDFAKYPINIPGLMNCKSDRLNSRLDGLLEYWGGDMDEELRYWITQR